MFSHNAICYYSSCSVIMRSDKFNSYHCISGCSFSYILYQDYILKDTLPFLCYLTELQKQILSVYNILHTKIWLS